MQKFRSGFVRQALVVFAIAEMRRLCSLFRDCKRSVLMLVGVLLGKLVRGDAVTSVKWLNCWRRACSLCSGNTRKNMMCFF